MIATRDATEADLPAIVDIYNRSIPGGWSTADTTPITVDSRRTWFSQFDPARRPIWVAEEEGQIVAVVYITSWYAGRPAYDKTAEISVYIAPTHQGRGLGTTLKQKMIDACPKLGVTTLLSLYFDHNQATTRINEKLGFVEVGHLPEIAEIGTEKRGLKIGMRRI
jgi:L-amino acid N-acyltransferase YncA